jgi:3-isopropylmalate dehydrogenase
MLHHSLKLEDEALMIERAVDQAIADGARTVDLGGKLTTRQMTDEIIKHL